MYPHERSLVARFAGQPFVLLGVNSDDDPATLRQAMVRQDITWRSWADGSTAGRIATSWCVHNWPTLFVLDARGVIRYQKVAGHPLEEAVEKLLQEMQKS